MREASRVGPQRGLRVFVCAAHMYCAPKPVERDECRDLPTAHLALEGLFVVVLCSGLAFKPSAQLQILTAMPTACLPVRCVFLLCAPVAIFSPASEEFNPCGGHGHLIGFLFGAVQDSYRVGGWALSIRPKHPNGERLKIPT